MAPYPLLGTAWGITGVSHFIGAADFSVMLPNADPTLYRFQVTAARSKASVEAIPIRDVMRMPWL